MSAMTEGKGVVIDWAKEGLHLVKPKWLGITEIKCCPL